jgi:hypothetical protein
MDPTVRNDRVATDTGVAPAEEVAPGTTPLVGHRAPVAPVAPVGAAAPIATSTGGYSVGSRLIQLVWLIAGVVDIILALDFVFRAVPANNTGFAHYIYRLGGWLGAPFDGIFNTTTANHGTSVFRWSDVLAVVIYSVAAWIVARLVRITSPSRRGGDAL